MKNNEVYKDPTAAKAVAMEAMREKLRQQYGIKEGQKISVLKRISDKDESGKMKKVRMTVYQIYKHFVVLEHSAGYKESMDWNTFVKSICR